RQPFSNRYGLAYATLRGEWRGYRLTSAFSLVGQDLDESFDATLPEGPTELFRQRNRLEMVSLETRIAREAQGGGWLAGLSLLANRTELDRAVLPPGRLLALPGVANRLAEQTLFAEATRPLWSGLSLTLGARLSHVSFTGSATEPQGPAPDGIGRIEGDEWRLLPAAALGASLGSDLRLYLRYQESFRPGGAIVRTNAAQRLESDRIQAWEAGLRFGHGRSARLSGAVSASYSRWNNVQADLIDTTGLPTTANLGDGEIWTLDGRLEWRATPALRLGVAAVVSRSRVSNPDPGIIFIEDEPLPNVPDLTATASVDYRRPLGASRQLELSARARYVGKSTLGIGPILERAQGDYVDTSLEARITGGRWIWFVAGTNLLNTEGNRFALGSVLTLVSEDQVTPLRPLTVRVGVETRF
ncbi:MAG TPA: TonB-dependent receptor, partial [Allosphingosinicella sp.]